MGMLSCPECGQMFLQGGNLLEGQYLTCPYCRTRLEIINLDPLELDWAYVEPLYPQEEFEDNE